MSLIHVRTSGVAASIPLSGAELDFASRRLLRYQGDCCPSRARTTRAVHMVFKRSAARAGGPHTQARDNRSRVEQVSKENPFGPHLAHIRARSHRFASRASANEFGSDPPPPLPPPPPSSSPFITSPDRLSTNPSLSPSLPSASVSGGRDSILELPSAQRQSHSPGGC
ncbi:hypothetical protein NL676_016682 [Syzygium grande]|nr:hypothetical protein NL676_016682 [Syzygium grande]